MGFFSCVLLPRVISPYSLTGFYHGPVKNQHRRPGLPLLNDIPFAEGAAQSRLRLIDHHRGYRDIPLGESPGVGILFSPRERPVNGPVLLLSPGRSPFRIMLIRRARVLPGDENALDLVGGTGGKIEMEIGPRRKASFPHFDA